jgi:hypothetical protein
MSPPDGHVVVAMDDTHLRKSGKHTPGVAYRRDPLSPRSTATSSPPRAVDRQPAFAVASYSMLLLSGARVFGASAVQATPPPPKWRCHGPKQRITTQELVQDLRSELWSLALEQPEGDSGHLVTEATADTKCPKPLLPLPAGERLGATG